MQHAARLMEGPFKLGSMPQGYFTENPYTEDNRCLKGKRQQPQPKIGPRFGIFKPTSYTKWV